MSDDGMGLGVLEHDAVVTLWDVASPDRRSLYRTGATMILACGGSSTE